jgi:iron(II)-dependent oxidoreductase
MHMLVLLLFSFAGVVVVADDPMTLAGPASRASFADWYANLTRWRNETLSRVNSTGSAYDNAHLTWTQTSYVQAQVHPFDLALFSPTTGQFTVSDFLDGLRRKYGGLDSVLLWNTYPNIGIDDRNQYDFWRAVPGGLTGFARMIAAFKAEGVRTLVPYNPWDTGTRVEEDGATDDVIMARMAGVMDFDGVNGDTLEAFPESFWTTSVAAGHPLALEPEIDGTYNTSFHSTMGWGYWTDVTDPTMVPPFVPPVDAFKWLESRRMTYLTDRWAKNKTDLLQFAYFNGIGVNTWENVWGTFNGIVPRDAEAIRRAATVLRFFGGLSVLTSPGWVPHAPVFTSRTPASVFASVFPGPNSTTAVLFVNRAGADLRDVPFSPTAASYLFDCWNGVAIDPANPVVSRVDGGGFGCLLALQAPASAEIKAFLSRMAAMTVQPLSSFSPEWRYLPQTMIKAPRYYKLSVPTDMKRIPAAAAYRYYTLGKEIEGDSPWGVDFQFPWEDSPRKEHDEVIKVRSFAIDTFPVTASQFAAYLAESHYVPADDHNFLKGWNRTSGSQPTPPPGWENKPVTWISVQEATAYCRFQGKRLPTPWEWQLAAQGLDGRIFPWGNTSEPTFVPEQRSGRVLVPPDDVDAHPMGASPYGVQDLMGNVWQMTAVFEDAHTRALFVVGSSRYRPNTSGWYFRGFVELYKHNKLLLMSESYDRSGMLGFRCVADLL